MMNMSIFQFNRFLSLIFLLSVTDISAQNLVQNGSFEEYENLNCEVIKNDYKIQVKYWFSSNPYNGPLTASNTFDSVSCIRYLNAPRTGKVAMMLRVTNEFTGHENMSYLQAKLISPLEIGKLYHIEFWMQGNSNAPKTYNNISFVFSPKIIKSFSDKLNIASTVRKSEVTYQKEGNWIRFSTEFIPNSQVSFFLIGNFFNGRPTDKEAEERKNKNRTYYVIIDDVKIIPVDKTQTFEEVEVGESIVLENIYFDYNKATLKPESDEGLIKLLKFLNSDPKIKIEILGHTDNQGDAVYNKNLSERRAKTVYEYLNERNVTADRISYKGYGSEKPIASNQTEEGRSRNRRVEFTLLEK